MTTHDGDHSLNNLKYADLFMTCDRKKPVYF